MAALQERGEANAMASQTGLASVSLNEVLGSVAGNRNRAVDTIGFNRDSSGRQIDREMAAAGSQTNSRISSVARPSMTQMGFDMAGAVLQGAGTYVGYRNRQPAGN